MKPSSVHLDFASASLDDEVAVAFGTDTSTIELIEIMSKLGLCYTPEHAVSHPIFFEIRFNHLAFS